MCKYKYSAIDIAKYVINKTTIQNKAFTNRQLNNLLYLIQKQYFREFDIFMFNEDFIAYPNGPSIKCIYEEYKYYGGNPIALFYNIHLSLNDEKWINNLIDNFIKIKNKYHFFTYKNTAWSNTVLFCVISKDSIKDVRILKKEKLNGIQICL